MDVGYAVTRGAENGLGESDLYRKVSLLGTLSCEGQRQMAFYHEVHRKGSLMSHCFESHHNFSVHKMKKTIWALLLWAERNITASDSHLPLVEGKTGSQQSLDELTVLLELSMLHMPHLSSLIN